ncbi:MAG: hypothetical protein JWO74_2289 [Solirubrobacterales bacterium]|nr:hypothetical protein [Solirubrobacterales bacterium]
MHPATMALAAAGSSSVDVAAVLGVTSAAVSSYFAGINRPHPDLPEALRELVGADAARNVLALIPERDAQGPA